MKRCHKYHFLYLQLIVRKVMPHVMIKYANYPRLWLVRAISETRLAISTSQSLYSKRQTLSLSNGSIDIVRMRSMMKLPSVTANQPNSVTCVQFQW